MSAWISTLLFVAGAAEPVFGQLTGILLVNLNWGKGRHCDWSSEESGGFHVKQASRLVHVSRLKIKDKILISICSNGNGFARETMRIA